MTAHFLHGINVNSSRLLTPHEVIAIMQYLYYDTDLVQPMLMKELGTRSRMNMHRPNSTVRGLDNETKYMDYPEYPENSSMMDFVYPDVPPGIPTHYENIFPYISPDGDNDVKKLLQPWHRESAFLPILIFQVKHVID